MNSGEPNQVAPAIRVTDLTVAYGDKTVLWDIDIEIPKGAMVAVVGPNGAGKTTLIKSIQGLVPRVAGVISIHGRPYEKQRKEVSYVPQRGSVALQASVKAKGFDVEIGGSLYSDSMGSLGTEEGTYIGMFKSNVDTVVESLNRNLQIAGSAVAGDG